MNRLMLPLVLFAAACGGGPTSRVVAMYGGESGWASIGEPERVTAYRVMQPGVVQHVRAPDLVGGHEVISGPVAVDAATAAELRAIFADDSIYDWERAKACEFDPGVAIRFTRAAADLDVLLCFSCDELAVYRGDKRVGGEDFDPARPRLLAIVKRLFPDDEKIQALKDRRTGG